MPPRKSSPALRAAVYARLSVSSDESTSVERQHEAASGYANLHGWSVVHVFTDDGISGGKGSDERPGLTAALEAAERGAYDVLIVAKLDRLARSVRVFSDVVERLREAEVDLVSVAESIDMTGPGGRMVATVLASFAQFERERIGERVKESHAALAAAGRYAGAPTPYGWTKAPRLDGPGLRLVLDQAGAPVLREVVDSVLRGATVAATARRLRAAGHDVPNEDTLRKLLRAPILLGQHAREGRPVVGADGLPLTPHEPLVSPAEFRALGAALDRLAAPAGRPRGDGGTELLAGTGLAMCAECGSLLRVNRQRRTTRREPRHEYLRVTYLCGNGCASIRADVLDEYVSAVFLDAVGRFPVILVEVDTDDATEALEAARERREAVRRMFAAGVLTEEEATEDLRSLTATVARLEAEAAAPKVRRIDTGRTFAETWEGEDVVGRRALLARALESISVAKGERGRAAADPAQRTRIVWRAGESPED